MMTKKLVYDIIDNWFHDEIMEQFQMNKLMVNFMGEYNNRIAWHVSTLSAVKHFDVWLFCKFFLNEDDSIEKFEINVGGIIHNRCVITVTSNTVTLNENHQFEYPFSKKMMQSLVNRLYTNVIANHIVSDKCYLDTKDELLNSIH